MNRLAIDERLMNMKVIILKSATDATVSADTIAIAKPRPPFPPFNAQSATQKVRIAEDAWNTRDPERVSIAYTQDSVWRNRSEFLSGREAIVQFLTRKWSKELDYRLIKELWTFHGNRIAVRFAYEWHDDSGHWFRSYGNPSKNHLFSPPCTQSSSTRQMLVPVTQTTEINLGFALAAAFVWPVR